MNNSTQAVVLSGGGAYGAYEVGVLKALVERGWAGPQVVTGVSAGAFNAALLASAYDVDLPRAVEHIEDIWLNRIPGRVFHVRADPRSAAAAGVPDPRLSGVGHPVGQRRPIAIDGFLATTPGARAIRSF